MKTVKIILILVVLPIFLQGQDKKKIEFINANRFFTIAELGPSIKIFVGEVVLEHDSTTMYCDSALYDTDLKKVDAFGEIEIQRLHNYDTIFLYGDTLHYNGQTKIAKVRDNVVMEQDTTVLTTDILDYDLNTKYGKYSEGGQIISGDDTINSVYGYYYAQTKDVFFKKDVVVRSKKAKVYTDTLKHNMDTRISYLLGPSEIYNDTNYIYAEYGRYDYNENRAYLSKRSLVKSGEHSIMADSLFYNRDLGYGKGFGNVVITDTIQNMILKGHYGEFYESGQKSFMTDSAVFIEIDEPDTLWLHSDTLTSYIDTLFDDVDTIPYRMLFAYNHVKMFKENLQLRCDSLVYSQLDSVLKLFGNPFIWSEQQQLYAQYIELYMSKNNPKELFMYDSTFMAEKIDSGKFNIIKGDFVHAWFKGKSVNRVREVGNIDALYYMQDDKDSTIIIGIGVLECDSMNIFLEDSKIDILIPYIEPSGIIYPPDKIPPSKKTLPGFIWLEAHRPKNKYDIFNWTDIEKENTLIDQTSEDEDIEDNEDENNQNTDEGENDEQKNDNNQNKDNKNTDEED